MDINNMYYHKIIGVVAEFRGPGIVNSTIRYVTKSNISHVEFLFEDLETTYGSRSHHILNGKITSGVNFYSISDGYFKNPKIFLFNDPLHNRYIHLTNIQNETLINELIKEYKKKYDYKGIKHFILNTINNDNSKWYCSELIINKCLISDINLLNIEPESRNHISPGDIIKSPLLKLYEGE